MKSKEPLDDIINLQNQGEVDFSLKRKELAMGLVETFSGDHLTPSRKLAAEIIIGMPEGLSDRRRIDYIVRSLDSASEEIKKDTVIGIVEDYKVLQEAFLSYMEDIDEGSLAGKALKLKDNQTIPDDLDMDGDDCGKSPWAENPSIPVPHLDNLINVFSTKGEGDKGIGLETAMIAGAITLSNLKVAPYHSAFAYKCAVFA